MNLKKIAVIIATAIILIGGGYYQLAQPAQQGPSAHGQVYTIDQGQPLDAEAAKQPVPFSSDQWVNGSFTSVWLGPGNLTLDFGDRITVRANLVITPQGSTQWVWNPANQSGDTIWYWNTIANVSYENLDTILKEQITLYQPVRSIVWNLNLNVKPQTLQVSIDGNDYLIRDPTIPDQYFRVRMPYVVDANGVRRDLRYSWNNGQRRLTLTQDFSGLTYPLTIDPTIQVVDSATNTGWNPIMLINQSGYPMIVYQDKTNSIMKLATNISGVWSVSKLSDSLPTNSVMPVGATIDPATDMPILGFRSPKVGSDYYYNITYFVAGVPVSARTLENTNNGVYWLVYPNGFYNFTSGRVLFPIYTSYTLYPYNISIVDTDRTIYTSTIGVTSIGLTFASSGGVNSSNIANYISTLSLTTSGIWNWTTITDSTSPTIITIKLTDSSAINGTHPYGIYSAINPATDFPATVYVPANGGATIAYNGSAINYSYLDGATQTLTHERIYWNTSIGSRNALPFLKYNSSGYAYVAWVERYAAFPTSMTTANNNPSRVLYSIRTGTNTWTSPREVIPFGYMVGYMPPTIAFDANDGLHIAAINGSGFDLLYYFEPLPSAGGEPPNSEFSCTPLVIIRNQTVVCTDASTNTPTSWDWYSDSGVECFSGNLTDQNPVFFPMNMGYCDVCEIAANTFGTDTECKTAYLFTRKPVFS